MFVSAVVPDRGMVMHHPSSAVGRGRIATAVGSNWWHRHAEGAFLARRQLGGDVEFLEELTDRYLMPLSQTSINKG